MSKELIVSVTKKDLEIQTFRSGGKGGQHQNTTDSGVRIIHHDSGAVGESRTERSQHQNKKLAFNRLVNSIKFKTWVSKKAAERFVSQEDIEKKVNVGMREENLLIETGNEKGEWERIS